MRFQMFPDMKIKVARNSFLKTGNLRFRSVFLENYYLFENKENFSYIKQHTLRPTILVLDKILVLCILNY